MGKKSGFGLVALAAAAGAAAVAVKYLKDYTDFKTAAENDFREFEDDTHEAKSAAQRTYISICEKGDVKGAAGQLAKAAGEVAKDAGSIAKKAGQATVQTVKSLKERYDQDPEGTKSEVIGNFREIGADVTQKVSDAASSLSEKLKNADSEDAEDFETAEEETADTAEQKTAEAMAAAKEMAEDIKREVTE